MTPQTLPTASRDRVATITPADVRRLLAETAWSSQSSLPPCCLATRTASTRR